MTWPTSTIGDVALLRLVDQPMGAAAHLPDRAGRATTDRGRPSVWIESIDDQLGPGLVDRPEHVGERGLGVEPQVGSDRVEPFGAEPHLGGALLGAHVERGVGTGGQELEQQRALADAGLAAEQRDRSGDEAAAEHGVELVDPGRDRPGRVGSDLADPASDRTGWSAPAGPARGRPAPPTSSSTSVFQSPHSVQRPAHFGVCAPHSEQANRVLIFDDFEAIVPSCAQGYSTVRDVRRCQASTNLFSCVRPAGGTRAGASR